MVSGHEGVLRHDPARRRCGPPPCPRLPCSLVFECVRFRLRATCCLRHSRCVVSPPGSLSLPAGRPEALDGEVVEVKKVWWEEGQAKRPPQHSWFWDKVVVVRGDGESR